MKNDFNQYVYGGIPFIIIGLLVNPWLLSWLMDTSFSTTLFSGTLFISILLIVIGWGIIYKRNKFLGWMLEKYKDIAIIFLNLVLLVGVVNFISAIVLHKKGKTSPVISYFHTPQDLFNDSIDFMRNIYLGKSDSEILELIQLQAPYANHPILEFHEKVHRSDSYNVGFEGIRYDPKVTEENAASIINGAVWVFGGSTTFGQGVRDDETITAYLNRIDTSSTYINFGIHAYHQSNEIEKMILLLKKGYLPSRVIFIDGLNDITRMIETNYHPLETPALAKSAYGSDFNIATTETGNTVLKQLPATRLFRSIIGKEKGPDDNLWLPWLKYDNIYDPDNLYNTNPRQHFRSTILRSPYKEIDTTALNYIAWKLEVFYKANLSFLEKISNAYGFEYSVYFQPIGIISPENPFWKDELNGNKAPLFRNLHYLVPKLKSGIAQWNLPSFYDISDVHDRCPACYVDLTHYNPQLNKMVAEAILGSKGEASTAISTDNEKAQKIKLPL
jgi:hypothetical protein